MTNTNDIGKYEAVFVAHAYAKAILVGEHIVLNGYEGIVMPIKLWRTTLTYHLGAEPLLIITAQSCEQTQEFNKFCNQLWPHLRGIAYITSNIPLKAGVGSSAALCVCIARLICYLRSECIGGFNNDQYHRSQFDVLQNATLLESYFHGKSSGIDVVGATAYSIKLYKLRPRNIQSIKDVLGVSYGNYKLGISFVGHKESTSSVRACLKNYHEGAKMMYKAVLDAKSFYGNPSGACQVSKSMQIKHLVSAIEKARQAFEIWQLIDEKTRQHMQLLESMGALACKPTGAGLGGCCISLWPSGVTGVEHVTFF